MAYIISMIVVIIASLFILISRYEVNTTGIQNELTQLKTMVSKIDSSVDNYLSVGENLTLINFQVLSSGHFLLSNSIISGTSFDSTMKFNGSDIIWHLIPNMSDSTSYKLMVDMSSNKTLMEKPAFAEMFLGTQLCEKLLFGDFNAFINTYDGVNTNFININGTNTDGIIGCTVYK